MEARYENDVNYHTCDVDIWTMVGHMQIQNACSDVISYTKWREVESSFPDPM